MPDPQLTKRLVSAVAVKNYVRPWQQDGLDQLAKAQDAASSQEAAKHARSAADYFTKAAAVEAMLIGMRGAEQGPLGLNSTAPVSSDAARGEEDVDQLREAMLTADLPPLASHSITEVITDLVAGWAAARGFEVSLEEPFRAIIPPRDRPSTGFLDVLVRRPGKAPMAIEIDRSDNRKSLAKLQRAASLGWLAVQLRWQGRIELALPEEVHLVDMTPSARKVFRLEDVPSDKFRPDDVPMVFESSPASSTNSRDR